MIATNKVVITSVKHNLSDPNPYTLREIRVTIDNQPEEIICRKMSIDLMERVLKRVQYAKEKKLPVTLQSRGNWTTKKWFNNVLA